MISAHSENLFFLISFNILWLGLDLIKRKACGEHIFVKTKLSTNKPRKSLKKDHLTPNNSSGNIKKYQLHV